MSTTSKKYFDEKFKNLLWEEFLKEIQKLKSAKELDNFLNKFFTPNEKIILEKRLAIIHLLKFKDTYRQISEKIDITRKTISFVKRGFKQPAKKILAPKKTKYSSSGSSAPQKNRPKYPTLTGKGRWRFLNSY